MILDLLRNQLLSFCFSPGCINNSNTNIEEEEDKQCVQEESKMACAC